MEKHPLIEQEQLKFPAWEISGKIYLQEYYKMLLQMPEDEAQSLITNQPGKSGIAGQ